MGIEFDTYYCIVNIEHLSIFKWKRNFDWEIVRDKFKETLNQAQSQ